MFMKKSLKVYLAGALVCAASLFAIVACEKDEKSAPGAAGAISGATANECPATTVALSIGEIENAASYKWYKDGTAISGATSRNYTAIESGSYAVAGVNSEGEGAKSAAHVVTIASCDPPVAGTITGETTGCLDASVVLTASSFTGADSYKWYKGSDAIPDATAQTYSATESGTYTVAGVNSNGEGAKSAAHVVTFSDCAPAVPGAAGAISADTLDCPNYYVVLSIETVENATSYQWYFNDTPITNATASTYLVTQNGSYKVAGVNGSEQGAYSEPFAQQIVPCVPNNPFFPVQLSSNSSPSSITSCDAGSNSVTLKGALSTRATSYTWYITKTPSGEPEVLATYDYVDIGGGVFPALTYTATQTGTYTTAGVNEWGTSEHSGGFYFEVATIACAPPANMGTLTVNTSYAE